MDEAQIQSVTLVRELVHGRWKAQALAAMLRLGIPELLDRSPQELPDMAASLRVDPDGLARLMRLTVALGLAARDEQGRFVGTPASALLTPGHPAGQLLDALHTLSPSMGVCWDNLEYSVRTGTSGFEHQTGQPIFDYLRDRPAEADVTHAFQAQATRWNVPGLLAAGVFPEDGVIVDVGGGNGTTLVELLTRRPQLRGVLLDMPDAIERARKVVADTGLADRVELREGDFFSMVPTGGDCYLLSHVLHDWPDTKAREILRNTAAAMGPQARLLIVELDKSDDGGWVMAYLDLLVLVGLGGRERSLSGYRELVEDAGLEVVGQLRIGSPEFPLGVTTARPRPAA